MLPGGGAMHLCDSVGKRKDIDYVCCLHEQACAFAAEAFAEYDNKLGCVLVTTGPGGTNALTGVAAAWIESAPVLVLSGQVKRADLMAGRAVRSMGPQEVDIISIARPITKFPVRVTEPLSIRRQLEEAVYWAMHGRKGPVWIDIPLDVQATEIQSEDLVGFTPPAGGNPSVDIKAEILDTLNEAARPVLYIGNGVRTSGQKDALRKIVSRLKVPVLLTWKAADLLAEDNPYYIGRPGGMGQRAANLVQQKADWMLILGARLDLPSIAFDAANFAPRAHKIMIDIEQGELAKLRSIDFPIQADLSDILPELENVLNQSSVPNFSGWLAEARALKDRFPVVLEEYWKRNDAVSTYVLIKVLADASSSDDVIVPGSSGPCSDILMQAWAVKDGQRILNAPGLGAMGTGLPATIGACLASGRRRTINVNGDGGFQLNIQELETVRRLGLPIKFFVLDNGGYASIVAMQNNHFKGRLVASDASSGLTLPSLERVAEAYGIPVTKVRAHSELRSAVKHVLGSDGPALCIVTTSITEATAPKCTAEIKPDGTVVSKPMHDMWPFLDPTELDEIMRA